jgi:quercetin dioxygenase-like cupin family protein
MSAPTRRIVTGHDSEGRSIVASDGPVPHVRELPGATFYEVWATGRAPEPLGRLPAVEPTSTAPRIGPTAGGSQIRVIDFPPASRGGVRSPMHRTRTIDYGIVLEGEMVMLLTDAEVNLKAGDVVVQRATDHAWENRSDRLARMAFVLIDAAFDAELGKLLGRHEIWD